MNITLIGAGYVGLVTAVCLADLGNNVICVEKDSLKIEKLKKGVSTIYEPGLVEKLKKTINELRLNFTDSIKKSIDFAEVIFLCVGTPQRDDGTTDLTQIEEAARQIAINMKNYKLIVEKSTVPVNTHKWIKKTIHRYAKHDIAFDVASNPEFLREGSAIQDFMNPDRIVIGVESDKAKMIMAKLYEPFSMRGIPIIMSSPAAAELIKHASNSFLAMKISYINMISDLCEKVGTDVIEVAKGMGYDKRIGMHFLNAGIGYGGSCFPKDVKAFIKIAEEHGVDFNLLREVEKINRQRINKFLELIKRVLWINKDKNIAVWGLSFKPDTDDVRKAPSIDIVEALMKDGASLRLYDPKAMDNFKKIFKDSDNLRYGDNKYEVLKQADALLIITEWDEFKNADPEKIKKLMRLPIIIDGRNIYDIDLMKRFGFEYYRMGIG